MARPVHAEITLVSLQNCMVNLPVNTIAHLSNSDTPPQNVIVELQYRSSTSSSGAISSTGFQRSAYVGWTGMPSRSKTVPLFNERTRGGREQEIQSVEIDATFAKLLGITEGQKIGLLVHLRPYLVTTVHIEPLTPADWEAIELHASFLELNLLSQIRALPNPGYKAHSTATAEHGHPLSLHLSPTSTASIVVTSLAPDIPSNIPFAKIAPDAEVIVASKTRPKGSRIGRGDTRSVASRQSGKSQMSARQSASKRAAEKRPSVFLRGVDWAVGRDFLTIESSVQNAGLKVWLPNDVVSSDALKGASFVSIKVLKPAGLRVQLDQTQMQRLKDEEASAVGRPAGKIVARAFAWQQPLDHHHAILSTPLCKILGIPGLSGLIIQVEAAVPPLPRQGLRTLRFYPFLPMSGKKKGGLKFGGDSKIQRQALIDRMRITHGGDDGLLSGPLTDGMVIPPGGDPQSSSSFDGGILRFERSHSAVSDSSTFLWALGGEQKQDFEVHDEIPHPIELTTLFPTFAHNIPSSTPLLIGVEKPLKSCTSNLTLCSSILLTGGIGSGKSTLAQYLGVRLRRDYLFNVTFFSCQTLTTDETRVSTIKDKLSSLFMSAAWCARLGGQSLVILDDLDKICPVETELQVGNDNGRSRQVTELFCSIVRQYCGIHSGVALLATAQSKDSLNTIIIGGHIVGEIVALKAPSKETRRDILTRLLSSASSPIDYDSHEQDPYQNGYSASGHNSDGERAWLNPSNPSSRPGSSSSSQSNHHYATDGFETSPSLDLLEIAGKTDGYMPADLSLLTGRARSECLIRTVTDANGQQENGSVRLILTKADFAAALRGFTPSSLRNVSLTHSTTSFAAIGGLRDTRNTLLETLLYPTKYAPIFSKSPLRLRSGLLLYGYPGCGKTLLASAIASEANLNFISVKGPEILNKYIGASEKSVRDLFERAQAARPCILFFDEFDSIAPKRGHDSTGVTDRVVNQMLTQMDGAEGLEGVYVLAATSRPDLIDPALLRPGRLDKSLLCDMPNQDDRTDILRAVSQKLHLTVEVASRLSEIAARTEGFSGADLQALMYNSHLEAIHDLLNETGSSTTMSSSSSSQHSSKQKSTHPTNHNTNSPNGTSTTSTSNSASRTQLNNTNNNINSTANNNNNNLKKPNSKDDFIQFLYGAAEDAEAKAAPTTASLDPRATIAAKLEELKLARRREKDAIRNRGNASNGARGSTRLTPSSSSSSSNSSSYYSTHVKRGANGDDDGEENGNENENNGNNGTGSTKVVITWNHVEKSLRGTRASISPQERRRLEGIYREFVVGRNGEMPSGDGGREVGGRSTLM